MTAWSEEMGRVSRAFNDWVLTDQEQRAFLRLGLLFSGEAYDRLWAEAGSEPGDPDGPDHLETFEAKVDGLHPYEYEWMHNAAVLRDAVTSFEVYLAKAREEVLHRHGHPRGPEERQPRWGKLRQPFEKLGVDLETEELTRVRDLRHFLTHWRGELRTEEQRKKFAAETDGIPEILVSLDEAAVLASMDVLAAHVRSADQAVYVYTWGRQRHPDLLA
jgi:hypothetical protein